MAYEPNDHNSMSHGPLNPHSRPANGMASQGQHRNGYNSQKENGMPVPGASGYYRNVPENSPMIPGPPPFDMARSPPGGTNKSRFEVLPHVEHYLLTMAQTPNMFLANSSGKAPARPVPPAHFLTLWIL